MSIEETSVIKNRGRISAALRLKVLEKYNNACVMCGVSNEEVPLEFAHLVAISSGGDSTEENLIILCPNCNRTFDRHPREIEFVNFLTELIKNHPSYIDVKQDVFLGRETRFRADILVQRRLTHVTEDLLIECKTPTVLSSTRTEDVIKQLKNYGNILGNCQLVLAVPATLRERDLAALSRANIEVWDLPTLVDKFSEQIPKVTFSYYKRWLQN